MRKRFEEWGYALCWREGRIAGLWARVWYRFYCPYPLTENHSARACIASGNCGCDNNPACK